MFKSHGICCTLSGPHSKFHLTLHTCTDLIVKLLKNSIHSTDQNQNQILIGLTAAVAFIFYLMIWYGLAYYSTHTQVN